MVVCGKQSRVVIGGCSKVVFWESSSLHFTFPYLLFIIFIMIFWINVIVYMFCRNHFLLLYTFPYIIHTVLLNVNYCYIFYNLILWKPFITATKKKKIYIYIWLILHHGNRQTKASGIHIFWEEVSLGPLTHPIASWSISPHDSSQNGSTRLGRLVSVP